MLTAPMFAWMCAPERASVAGAPASEIVRLNVPFVADKTFAAKVAGVCEIGFRFASIVLAMVVYHQSRSLLPL